MAEQDQQPTPLADGGDPADFTVAEVNAYLDSADDAERARILDAEAARGDDARVGITEGTHARAATETAPDAPNVQAARDGSTAGATFAQAAGRGNYEGPGRLGASPEADRTGRRDKGLSQRNPAILNGGPVPDARENVDDSEALAALDSDQED